MSQVRGVDRQHISANKERLEANNTYTQSLNDEMRYQLFDFDNVVIIVLSPNLLMCM